MKNLMICYVETELRHSQTFRIRLLVPDNTHLSANDPEVNNQGLKHVHNQMSKDDLVSLNAQIPMSPICLPTTVDPRSHHQALTPSTVRQRCLAIKHLKEVTDPNGNPFL